MRRHNQLKRYRSRCYGGIDPIIKADERTSRTDEDVRAAVFGYIRNISNNFHKFLRFHFSDRDNSVTMRTDPQWNEANRKATISLYEDKLQCSCPDLEIDHGISYADPKMFDSIERFISRIYNG